MKVEKVELKATMTFGPTMTIKKPCPLCGVWSEAEVDTEAYYSWQGGELIQKAMPQVPVATREFLISGICRDCQKKMAKYEFLAEL